MEVDPVHPAAAPQASTDAGDAPSPEEREANQAKFELELEALCSLANPHYLQDLSASGHLEPDSPFLNFLEYLEYWEEPAYAKYIIYPQALHHRRLLLQPAFRTALRMQGASLVQKLADVQFQHWRTWRADKPAPPPNTEGV